MDDDSGKREPLIINDTNEPQDEISAKTFNVGTADSDNFFDSNKAREKK